MQGYSAEGYRTFVRNCLDRVSDRAVEEIKTILGRNESLHADMLKVEILPEGIMNELPVRLCLAPGRMFDLGKATGPPLTPIEKELACSFDENGVETLEIEIQVLIEWFSTCWQAAQGSQLPIPAFLSIENDLEVLDLKEMNWVSKKVDGA